MGGYGPDGFGALGSSGTPCWRTWSRITVHTHAAGQNFTGNVFGWNWIGTNNVGGDYADPHTTGIYIGSVGSLSVVVLGNRIHDNRVGIFKAGPVSLRRRFSNSFVRVHFDVKGTHTYAG